MSKYLLLILIVFLILPGCKSSSEPPVEKPPKEPGELVWSADTISYPGSAQTLMERIWAADSNNIWILGHNDQSLGQIFKYDGTGWKEVQIFEDIPKAFIRLNGLWGFSKDNVYVVGSKRIDDPYNPGKDKDVSYILHYDGIKWTDKMFKFSYPLQDVWGSSPDNLWACGDSGVVFHYNGTDWSETRLDKPHNSKSEYRLRSVSGNNTATYFLGMDLFPSIGKENDYIFKIENGNSSIFDKCEDAHLGYKFGNRRISYLNGILYTCGLTGLFRYNGGDWENLVNTNYMTYHHYESPNKLHWAVGYKGSVFYSKDKTDWHQLTQFADEKVWYQGIWSDDYTTIIIGYTLGKWPQKTIILKGK